MAEVIVSKQVFFIGAWRTQNVTDNLLQQISKQMHNKEGYSTLLNLTTDGLYLNINNINGQTTKTDRIPLEIIADFIDNKYSSTCVLAIVKDKNQYTVFVFLCRSEQDSAVLVQEFQKIKKRLSGEGYNLDMKQTTGVNWTLKNKEGGGVRHHANGDVKVYTTTVGSNGVGVGDSVSNTSANADVRDELTDLAKEVRDIRLMMQKSHGRHHFAKHYGYLNGPPQPVQAAAVRQAYTTEEVFVTPEQISDLNVVKKHYIKREPSNSSNVRLVRGGQGGTYKLRQSTSGHFLRSTSQSSMAGSVRRRVYPSPAPGMDVRYAGSQVSGQSIRVVNPYHQQPYIRREIHTGSSSDIIHKNIEKVYKSKKYRRVIPFGPVSPAQHQIYDYVQTQRQQQSQAVVEDDIAPVRSVFIDEAPPKVVRMAPAHVRYEGEHLYENAIAQDRRDLSNVSTLVNVSSNDIVDESDRVEVNRTHVYRQSPQPEHVTVVNSNADQIRRTYEEERTTQSENVIVVSADGGEGVTGTSTSVHEDDNVIYIKSDHSAVIQHSEPDKVVGGGVYHVRAKGLDNYENYESGYYQAAEDDRNIVIIDRDEYQHEEPSTSSNVTVIRGDTDVLQSRPGVTVISHTDTNEGIWGEYAKEPEPYDPDVHVVEETSYRYTQHDENVTNDIDDELRQELNEEISTPEVTTPKRVGFLDEVEQTIDDERDDKINAFGDHVDDLEDKADEKINAFGDHVDDLEDKADEKINAFGDHVDDLGDDLGDKVDAVEDKVDENDVEVRDIIDKVIDDDENNNANRVRFDDEADGNDLRVSKGSLVSELRNRFNKESETTVLF